MFPITQSPNTTHSGPSTPHPRTPTPAPSVLLVQYVYHTFQNVLCLLRNTDRAPSSTQGALSDDAPAAASSNTSTGGTQAVQDLATSGKVLDGSPMKPAVPASGKAVPAYRPAVRPEGLSQHTARRAVPADETTDAANPAVLPVGQAVPPVGQAVPPQARAPASAAAASPGGQPPAVSPSRSGGTSSTSGPDSKDSQIRIPEHRGSSTTPEACTSGPESTSVPPTMRVLPLTGVLPSMSVLPPTGVPPTTSVLPPTGGPPSLDGRVAERSPAGTNSTGGGHSPVQTAVQRGASNGGRTAGPTPGAVPRAHADDAAVQGRAMGPGRASVPPLEGSHTAGRSHAAVPARVGATHTPGHHRVAWQGSGGSTVRVPGDHGNNAAQKAPEGGGSPAASVPEGRASQSQVPGDQKRGGGFLRGRGRAVGGKGQAPGAVPGGAVGSPTREARLAQLHEEAAGGTVDMRNLRRLSYLGLPDKAGVRSMAWKVRPRGTVACFGHATLAQRNAQGCCLRWSGFTRWPLHESPFFEHAALLGEFCVARSSHRACLGLVGTA